MSEKIPVEIVSMDDGENGNQEVHGKEGTSKQIYNEYERKGIFQVRWSCRGTLMAAFSTGIG